MAARIRRSYFFDEHVKRFLDRESKTLFMPYNIEPEDYSPKVKEFRSCGYVVQLEIV